jgi:hypothetical protein
MEISRADQEISLFALLVARRILLYTVLYGKSIVVTVAGHACHRIWKGDQAMQEQEQPAPRNTYLIDIEETAELARLMQQDRLATEAMGGLLPEIAELPPGARVFDLASTGQRLPLRKKTTHALGHHAVL